jgi:CPA2 family monovalent cation:H+ antiporter-2
MNHLPLLIEDLALILCAAGVFTLLFKWLRQPQVLGYLIAGFLVSPHFPLFPTVSDIESIHTWAEIGVIFLMFSLGLEFSFKKLIKVGPSSGITALVEVVGMLLVGYLTGKALGWSFMDSLFLGGILSISSTTIIIRAFEEAGVKTQQFARLVFGVLIVEDLVAILLLVLLSTLAVSKQFKGGALLESLLQLALFILFWFLGGIYLIPTFLRKAKKLMSQETLLIVSLALCMATVIVCTKAGFSAPLGAFIMGSIFAETMDAEKIEHLVLPLKDLFGAIFFVSVGMLIDPEMLLKHWGPILIITVVTISGKLLTSGGGALLAGQPWKTALKTGLSLAQIGEFSFIIATLGLNLKVTSAFLYPIAVAVSALTTFTTPYLIRSGDGLVHFLQKSLPVSWTKFLNRYENEAQTIGSTPGWKALLRSYLINLLIQGGILLTLLALSNRFLSPFIHQRLNLPELGADLITVGITLLVMSPFLWAMAFRKPKDIPGNKLPARGPLIVLDILRGLLTLALVNFLLDIYFPSWVALVVTIVGCTFIYLLFAGGLKSLYNRMEKRFLHNLGEREQAGRKMEALAPWDAHLCPFEVPSESSLVGSTLKELALREQFGINVALIKRGNRFLPGPPSGKDRIFPKDMLSILGTDEQLKAFSKYLDETSPDALSMHTQEALPSDVVLQKVRVPAESPIIAQSLSEMGIKYRIKGLVAGVERDGERLLNPAGDFRVSPNDDLWMVGEKNLIEQWSRENHLLL